LGTSSGICWNHGGASSPRAAMPRNGQTWDVFFSSPFSTGDLQKNTKPQQPIDFSSFFVCRFVFLPSLFLSLSNLELSLVACAANRPGVWMAGSATFLFPLHFYTGGVVHRCHGWEIGAPFKSRSSALPLLPFGLPSHFLIVSVMRRWRRDVVAGRLMVVGRERV